MHLTLTGSIKDQSPGHECDGYVPLVLRWPKSASFPPLYWRLGDFERTLIELGINDENGAICKVTVTSVERLAEMEPEHWSVESVVLGLPCCDLTLWADDERRIDERCEVKAYLVGRKFVLTVDESTISSLKKAYRSGNVAFIVDEADRLRVLEVVDLSDAEAAELRVACQPTNT